jgi:hypothetical protein
MCACDYGLPWLMKTESNSKDRTDLKCADGRK